MVVATYRPRSVPADHPLKSLRHELLLQRLAEEMTIEPLAKPVIMKLLCRDVGGAELPPRVSAFVHEQAEGNPMLALAILHHLITQKLLIRRGQDDEARWTVVEDFEGNAGIPEELIQMVELEIERLSDRDQRLLEAASLMPVAFPAWAVAAALDEDACEIEESCDALARRCCFVQRAGSDELPDGTMSGFYAFTHAFYRDVLYQRQAATRRARRHVRVAEKLGQLFAGRESLVAREMAMHYVAAGNWRLGVQALQSAARYASERASHDEAADLLERALHIAAGRDESRDVVISIREALSSAYAAKNQSTAGGRKTLTFS
jgi:predicted ATPase